VPHFPFLLLKIPDLASQLTLFVRVWTNFRF